MRKVIFFFVFSICATTIYAQTLTKSDVGKTFVFNFYALVNACDDAFGANPDINTTTAIKGTTFTIQNILANGDLIIKFNIFKKIKADSGQSKYKYRALYNLKVANGDNGEGNIKLFILDKATFANACSEFTFTSPWSFSFGTISNPFKFRTNPSQFQSNFNLGTSIFIQRKLGTNFFYGFILGLSLSSITLDNFSTNSTVLVNTDRPAVTPSLHAMIGYKNINLIAGIGWDYINLNSSVEKSWIYQGNRWFGVGIGISLFNTNTNNTSPTSDLQKTK